MSTGVMIIAVTLLILLLLKLPMFVAILGASAVYFMLTPGTNPAVFTQQAITGAKGVTLLAIPFFVCAGVLMNYTGATERVMDFCAVLTGRIYGGLSQVNILLNTLMSGLPGSALAGAAMETRILVPEMERKRIGRAFSTVMTAASGMITPLIPPEIGLTLYGCVANVSISKLLVTGSNPGILLCTIMMFMVSRISKRRGYLPLRTEKMHPSMFWESFRPTVLPLCLPIIIIGGMRLGVFTTTGTSPVAIVYAVTLSIVYRGLGLKEIAQGLKEMLQATSSIMLIMATTSTFSWILTREMVPQRFTEWMIQMINNKWTFLVAADIFLIFVGMFIEGNANMTALVPLFAPAAAAYGIDPVRFTMVFILVDTIRAFTPLMGTLVFVARGVTKCSTRDFIKEAAPFYTLLSGYLLVLIFVPLFSTGLVNLAYWWIVKWRRFRGRRRHC